MPLIGAPPPELLPPFRRADLPAHGITRHQLDVLLREGRVVQPLRGAYVGAVAAEDPSMRACAASLVLPLGAVLSRSTAAWLHGVDARRPDERDTPLPVECLVPAGRTVPQRHGLVPHEAALDERDVELLHDVLVTTAERTALDLARYLQPHMGLAVLDAMAGRGLVHPDDLAQRLEQWRGQRFVARARRLVDLCEPSTESYGESWLRLRVVDAGFPRPEPQVWIRDEGDRPLYRLDMGWPERRLAVEYDGEEFHSSLDQREHDRRRRSDLAGRFGWTVIGVGRAEVLGSSLALERGLGELLGIAPKISRRLW